MPTERMESERYLLHSVTRALYNAGKAFIQPERLEENAAILARAEYLDGPAPLIERAISDRITLTAGADPLHIPAFMFQHREAANFPWVSPAAWLSAQLVRAGKAVTNTADSRSDGRRAGKEIIRY